MRIRSCLVALAFTLSGGAPVWAEPPEAERAFLAGNYEAAARLSAQATDADSRAFTARALLAEAMSGPGEPETALLMHALDEATTALALEPNHIEGRLQKAIAISLLLRPMSLKEARRTGWGEEARDLAETVIDDDPDNFYAHGFLSVWHIEVVRRGGRIGSMIMGASLGEADREYAEAVRLSPGDAALHWQYARALAALDAGRFHDSIEQALRAALDAPIDSSLESVMQSRARTLLDVLLNAGAEEAEAAARQML